MRKILIGKEKSMELFTLIIRWILASRTLVSIFGWTVEIFVSN